MSAFYISAAHKSSGKTVVSVGLCAALRERGRRVQPFKKGPDYIDPIWLGHASGSGCHNLDFHTMSDEEIVAGFSGLSSTADVALIEGNKGLHDSVDVEGRYSNAALAKLLRVPVVLVIDARGMTRGIAALVRGLTEFDSETTVAGVILNRVKGDRHDAKLRAAIETYTDLRVLGSVANSPTLVVNEGHLGLVPASEVDAAGSRISRMAQFIAEQVDLDALEQLDVIGGVLAVPAPRSAGPEPDVKLAIARDKAFGFYYPDDLAALRAGGAQLVPVDTFSDDVLPDVDGLFLGGGFPERHMQALSDNRLLRANIGCAIAAGLPVYAECGGLMYLSREIVWGEQRAEMVGALDVEAVMSDQPQGRGYVKLRETEYAPWPQTRPSSKDCVLPAHEFHYSLLRNVGTDVRFAYDVIRGHGVDGRHDGIVHNNVLASYSHLRDTTGNRWTQRFLNFVRGCKASKATRSLS